MPPHCRARWVAYLPGGVRRTALLLGRANGSLSLIDYANKEVMVTYTFDCKPGTEPVPITSLKYSPNGAPELDVTRNDVEIMRLMS